MIRRIIGFVSDILARGRAAPPRSYPIISRPAGFLPAAAAPDCGDTAEFFQEAMVADVIPSSASIFDHGIEMMQLDPFRQFGPFFFTQTDHIELLHNHPSQLMASSLLGGNLSCLCITLNSY